METYIDSPYRSFEEETLGALIDREHHFVELGAADNTIKLATSAANVIGVLHERTSRESKDVSVRLLGKGGTVKVKCGGPVAKGGPVTSDATGKAVIAPGTPGGDRVFGRKLSQGTAAANDVIEILDVIETVFI